MLVRKAGAPSGPRTRSPSAEMPIASAVVTLDNNNTTTATSRLNTCRLNVREPGRLPRVAQRVVDRQQREIRVGHPEPRPVLVLGRVVGPLPEPDAYHLHPGPLIAH